MRSNTLYHARPTAVLAGALALATMVTMTLAGTARQAGASTSGPQVGVVSDITWGISAADVTTTVNSMKAAGVGWTRSGVSWSGAEPDVKGTWNEGYLTQVDSAIAQAQNAGMQVLMPLADGVPYWASGDPSKYQDGSGFHWNKYWKATNASDYASFVRQMVTRYSARGVHVFELWNEPNLARFWPSGPNAAEYVALLAAAYPAAKAADPSATVLMGGLSKSDYNYLGQLYAAGARPYFDAVAVHPYTGSSDPTWCWNEGSTTKFAIDAFCGIEEVRNTMVAAGDSSKNVWLTEFGWATTSGAYGVSEATQADYLTKAFTKLQSYPYVAAAFWYNFRNFSNDAVDYEANLGLVRRDFTTKPAYTALQSWTGTTSLPPAPKDITAPTLSNVQALNVGSTSARIAWTTNEGADSRVDYWRSSSTNMSVVDSQVVTSHSVALSSLAKRTTYSYRVRSTDAAGNSTQSSVLSFKTTSSGQQSVSSFKVTRSVRFLKRVKR